MYITQQNQVQVYETRDTDDRGRLTTSFVSLFSPVKDNRLLPAGWAPNRPSAEVTTPRALGGAPERHPVIGGDTLLYMIPRSSVFNATGVRVTIYYQSIPLYYLADRFSIIGKDPQADTLALRQLVGKLQTAGTPIAGWRLPVAAAAANISAR